MRIIKGTLLILTGMWIPLLIFRAIDRNVLKELKSMCDTEEEFQAVKDNYYGLEEAFINL